MKKKLLFSLLVAIAAVAWSPTWAETLIEYNQGTAAPAGVQISGSTSFTSAKIHTNADAINCIQLKNNYISNDDFNGNAIILSYEGGFKTGDTLSIAGFFNNTTDNKVAKVDVFTKDAEKKCTALWTSEQFINGRLVNDNPVVQNYVLKSDLDTIFIGRNGTTGTNLSMIKVIRPETAVITYDTCMYVSGSSENVGAFMQKLPYSTDEFPLDDKLEFKQVKRVIKFADGVAVDTTYTWYGCQNPNAYMTQGNSSWKLDSTGTYNVHITIEDWGDYTFYYNAENGHFVVAWPDDPAPVAKVYAKNNWNGGEEWTWKEMTYDGAIYTLDKVVFGGTGIYINDRTSDVDALWYDLKTMQYIGGIDSIQANDTVNFTFNKNDSVLVAELVAHPHQPVITYDTTMYVAGTFTNWQAGMQELPYAINLPEEEEIEFKQVRQIIKKQDGTPVDTTLTWYGQKTEGAYMTRESSSWKLDGTENVILLTDLAGDYAFSYNAEDGKFTVTWPEKPVKIYAKNNWDGASAWTWKEMTKDAGMIYTLDSVVFGGIGVNINNKEADEGALWYNLQTMQYASEADSIQANDTVSFEFNLADSSMVAKLIGHPVATFTVTANVNDPAMGSVTGAGEYQDGTEVTLTATANEGYAFKAWSNGETTDTISVVVTSDTTLTAIFKQVSNIVVLNENFDATTSALGYNSGYYNLPSNWSKINNGSGMLVSIEYYPCEAKSLYADIIPRSGEKSVVFDQGSSTMGYPSNEFLIFPQVANNISNLTLKLWARAYNNKNADNQIVVGVMTDPKDATTFTEVSALTFSAANVYEEKVISFSSYQGSGKYIAIRAIQSGSYYTVSIDDVELYIPVKYTLTANVNDSTMGSVTGAGTYVNGTEVTLTATPNAHYHFVNWSNGVTANSFSILVEKDSTVAANFAIDQHVVTANVNDDTMGSVTGAGTYDYGTTATLTATANEGYQFANWSNGATTETITIDVTSDTTLIANFESTATAVTNTFSEGEDKVTVSKFLRNGQLYLRRGDAIYDAKGAKVE